MMSGEQGGGEGRENSLLPRLLSTQFTLNLHQERGEKKCILRLANGAVFVGAAHQLPGYQPPARQPTEISRSPRTYLSPRSPHAAL